MSARRPILTVIALLTVPVGAYALIADRTWRGVAVAVLVWAAGIYISKLSRDKGESDE